MPDKDVELIDYPHVGIGMYLSLRNAKRHFEDGALLYENKKFQSAIPIFVICIEECFKSYELSIKMRKFQSVSQTDWDNLMNHQHKLNYVNDFFVENLENMSEEEFEKYAKETQNEEFIKYRKEVIQRNKAEQTITTHLQMLKEACLYQNWNKTFGEWDDFDMLKEEQKDDLAFFIMKRAAIQVKQLHFGIEYAVNIIRRDGGTLTDLEYPTYNEFREVKDYDTKLNDYNQIIDDIPKYHRGEKIMLALISHKKIHLLLFVGKMGLLQSKSSARLTKSQDHAI